MNFQRDDYYKLGKNITERLEGQLSAQLSVFKSALVNFASEHGDEITNNREFRTKFTQMCQLVGVDPLDLQILTTKKDLEVVLAVRVVEECHKTRDFNGGLISLKELISRLNNEEDSNTSTSLNITEENIISCLTILNSLGEGYEILNINKRKWLKFTNNVSNDHKKVYELCEFMGGFVTSRLLRDNFQWDQVRCRTVIDEMIMKGFLWVDLGENELQYWEPSWISS